MIDAALKTDDVLTRAIDDLDLRSILANLDDQEDLNQQVEAAVTKPSRTRSSTASATCCDGQNCGSGIGPGEYPTGGIVRVSALQLGQEPVVPVVAVRLTTQSPLPVGLPQGRGASSKSAVGRRQATFMTVPVEVTRRRTTPPAPS